jgi:hypothetical protein
MKCHSAVFWLDKLAFNINMRKFGIQILKLSHLLYSEGSIVSVTIRELLSKLEKKAEKCLKNEEGDNCSL